ncbi:TonB-dependent receptor [Horticoccus sp. 23ND18S-11]|uniref:TonB-dependent receptor n=1 Tax=Horticoccus sp. 23ND18S-11 TaxID=3391832 RepID=UPI0039C8D895
MNEHCCSTASPAIARTLRAIVWIVGLALGPFLFAQGVVSSGLTGVVRDNTGKPVPGATLTATHVPTGTVYTAVSSETGRYNFRGMVVGGPFTLVTTAPGKKPAEITEITTQLGKETDLNVALSPADVVVMEKFTVGGARDELDGSATGAASLLTRERILAQPTAQRSFADMARTNSQVTLRNVFGDRQEAMLTAVGQNNRFNSIMVDGARINDQFGLNASGLQSFFNPLSLETAEQVSISVSPYDVRQSGFTGAAINVVTRSGTNTFHGSLYGYYTDAKYAGRDQIGASAGKRPPDERKTWGATLGGPLWKNKLFFFGNYEKFERTQVASDPTMTPASADITTLNNAIAAIKTASGKTFDLGAFGGGGSLITEEEKKLYKVDWNITKDHRLSVRYNETVGTLPQFGRSNGIGGAFTGILGAAGPAATRGTAFSSNFYSQIRTEDVWAATLNDQWSQNLKTEFKWSKTNYEQLTTSPTIFPEIRVFGVAGTGSDGRPVTNAAGAASGVVVLGTEQFRHGNVIQLKTESYSGNADYFWKNFTFTGGFDREKSKFYNLFRQGSYGLFDYASLADFVADRPAAFGRSIFVQGTPAADISDFAITGIFGQTKWDVNSRLNVVLGARFDMVESAARPPVNQAFVNTFGIRNDGNVDDTQIVSPRLGFNWAVDDARVMQVRGGFGYFTGRAPWVFISNAYGNTGVGRFNQLQTGAAAPQLGAYIRNNFDFANPIGTAATDGDPNARREINLLQNGLKLPAVWRGNLAVERKLPIFDTTLTIEAIQTYNDKSLFTDNLNIRPLVVTATSGPAVGLDGRQRFNGGATSAGATSLAFTNVVRVRNISEGESTYVSIGLNRPMKNNWSYNATYTRGKSEEAQSFGQTVAVDGWSRNAVFNQNTIEVQRSDFEVRDRIQISLAKRLEFKKGWATTASLYYEGHTGNPFSYAYSNDLNNDGVVANDLVYVPNGDNDPKIDYSGLTATQRADLLAFIQSSGLGKYAGSHAPRNAFTQPWINQLDLRITQKLPIYKPVEVELFFDFINFGYWLSRRAFGYTELLTNTNNAVFYRRLMGAATYNAAGQVRPTYTTEPGNVTIDNIASRWRVQFGATVRF